MPHLVDRLYLARENDGLHLPRMRVVVQEAPTTKAERGAAAWEVMYMSLIRETHQHLEGFLTQKTFLGAYWWMGMARFSKKDTRSVILTGLSRTRACKSTNFYTLGIGSLLIS